MKKKPDHFDDGDEDSPSTNVSDWLKKTLLTGVGAVFMTEESIRHSLNEIHMPKSVIKGVLSQAEKTKKEITNLMAKEVRGFLDRIEIEEIIRKALVGQTVEIKASIKFSGEKSKKKIAILSATIAEDDDDI